MSTSKAKQKKLAVHSTAKDWCEWKSTTILEGKEKEKRREKKVAIDKALLMYQNKKERQKELKQFG